MLRPVSALTLSCFAFAAACAGPGAASTRHATAWMQTAAERDACCRQAFAVATRAATTAAPGETLPPAVIVDVDETMLDNSAYNARLLLDGGRYDPGTWAAWCGERKATAVPGALAFAQACHAAGVTVFYVTNRAASLEGDTRANLAALGFPLDDREGVDVVQCQEENEAYGRGSSKEARRQGLAARCSVRVYVGDDLGDFLVPAATVAARRQQVADHAADFGTRWFVLPNPMYGSWERAAGDLQRAIDPRR